MSDQAEFGSWSRYYVGRDLFRRPVSTFRIMLSCGAAVRTVRRYCVFVSAAARGGLATETNCVACRTPVPTGVGRENRYGTSTRVPKIGASQTSASRNAARYLIA